MRKTILAGFFLMEFLVASGLTFSLDKALEFANSYRNGLTIYNAPLYKNQREIFEDFKKEKRKLDLDGVMINFEIKEGNFTEYTQKIRKGHYRMKVNSRYLNRIALRHGLFHVKRMHSGKYMNYPILDGIEEWMATSYALEEPQNP